MLSNNIPRKNFYKINCTEIVVGLTEIGISTRFCLSSCSKRKNKK